MLESNKYYIKFLSNNRILLICQHSLSKEENKKVRLSLKMKQIIMHFEIELRKNNFQ